jgi:hypothetical protein
LIGRTAEAGAHSSECRLVVSTHHGCKLES